MQGVWLVNHQLMNYQLESTCCLLACFRLFSGLFPSLFGPVSCIQATANLRVMPSLSEPCRLSGLIALKYGTVPIVHPNWSAPGMPGRPSDTIAARSANGPATPIARSGRANAPYPRANVRFDPLTSISGYVGATDPYAATPVAAPAPVLAISNLAAPAGLNQYQSFAQTLVGTTWGPGCGCRTCRLISQPLLDIVIMEVDEEA